MDLTFDDITIEPGYSPFHSRAELSTWNSDKEGKLELHLPIISAAMDRITGPEMATYLAKKGAMGCLHRFWSIQDNLLAYQASPRKTFVTIGVGSGELERAEALRDAGAEYFSFDIAYAYSIHAKEMIPKIREIIGDRCLMAGNVCTGSGASFLEELGVDLIKVGVGPSSCCATRITAGVGIPQISALIDCSESVEISIVSDGGCRTAGDICKSLLFSDFVMIGTILAGTHYTPGQVYTNLNDDGYHKLFRGMAGSDAYRDKNGKDIPDYKAPEGVTIRVPYKDARETDKLLQSIAGGIRSCLSYTGCSDISDLQARGKWRQVSHAGYREGLTG